MDEAILRRFAELEARIAAQDAVIAAKDVRIAELEKQVAELLDRLNRNSGNSNKPPSSDAPSTRAERRAKNKEKSGKKRGGQPGHDGSQRSLVPAEKVDDVVDHFPDECANCWAALPKTPDASAQRYQTTELPPTKLLVVEHRIHSVTCGCGHRTTAAFELPPAFGPRLWSVIALLTGVFHLSRRGAVTLLSDVLGVEISLGAVSAVEKRVSDALKPAVDEAWQRVEQSTVKHTDGTTWYQSNAMRALWTIASTVATVFKIVATGDANNLAPLFGSRGGVLVSDRATALRFWAMEMRQVCWAHLLRKFISFSERGGAAGALGKELLDYVKIMFAYWDDVKVGKLSRADFRSSMAPVRKNVEAVLQRAVASKLAHVSGSCADILEFLVACCTAAREGTKAPSLFAA